MFSDRRIILGALVVLIGLLVFAIAGPLSNSGYGHEDHEADDHERHEATQVTRSHDTDFDYIQVIDKTFKVRARQTLLLETDFGKVTILGEDGNVVTVTITKGANDVSESKAEELFNNFEIDFDQDSYGVSVEGKLPASSVAAVGKASILGQNKSHSISTRSGSFGVR